MKQKKPASELAEMIKARMTEAYPDVSINVNKDNHYGWHVTTFIWGAQAAKCQLMAEQIAAELREQFELED